MKAIVVTDQAVGTAGVKLVERSEPQAAINDVVVQIHASGFTGDELTWPSTWTDRAGRECTECTRELIKLRKLRDTQRKPQIENEPVLPRNWRWAGIAAELLCCLAIGSLAYWRIHSSTSSSPAISARARFRHPCVGVARC